MVARVLSFARRAVRKLVRLIRGDAVRPHVGRLDYPVEIRMHVRTSAEAMRTRSCAKEPWTVRWLEERVGAGGVLYDVGANVGAYTLVAARALGARVVAFEPSPSNFSALCDNVVLNGVDDRVTPLPLALADATHLDVLDHTDLDAGTAIHTLASGPGPESDDDLRVVYRQPLLVYRLDDLVRQFDLPRPTALKLDVDGAEQAVVEGAHETLRSPELRSLLVEIERRLEDPVLAAIREAGFTLAQRVDERDGSPLKYQFYAIFERP